jgi:hypothetical protein
MMAWFLLGGERTEIGKRRIEARRSPREADTLTLRSLNADNSRVRGCRQIKTTKRDYLSVFLGSAFFLRFIFPDPNCICCSSRSIPSAKGDEEKYNELTSKTQRKKKMPKERKGKTTKRHEPLAAQITRAEEKEQYVQPRAKPREKATRHSRMQQEEVSAQSITNLISIFWRTATQSSRFPLIVDFRISCPIL